MRNMTEKEKALYQKKRYEELFDLMTDTYVLRPSNSIPILGVLFPPNRYQF